MNRLTDQQKFYLSASGVGLFGCTATFIVIIWGEMLWAAIGGFFLAAAIFVCIAWLFEKDPDTDKLRPLYCRGQSYVFMAGLILVPLMFGVAAHAWGNHGDRLVSTWAQAAGLFMVGLVVFVLAGVAFRRVDYERYREKNALAMLKSPSKWWLDHWQMPGLIALWLTTVVPTWWFPSNGKWGTIAITVVFVWLGYRELRHPPNPYRQHVRWDTEAFTPLVTSLG